MSKKNNKKKFENKKYEKIINQGYTIVSNDFIFNNQLSDGAKNLYLIMQALAIRSNEIEHSQKTLANIMGKSVRTIQRYLKELKEAGLLEIFFRLGRTNIYKVLVKIINKVKEVTTQVKENIQKRNSQNHTDTFKDKAYNAWFGYSQRKYNVDELEHLLGLNHQ